MVGCYILMELFFLRKDLRIGENLNEQEKKAVVDVLNGVVGHKPSQFLENIFWV